MTFALFGIENDGLNLAVNLLVFFLFVIYVALVYWTYADATRRLDDPMLIGCATVASLFPFIGTIIYTIVRPPEYLEDVHERELEIRAAEKRLALLENRTCRNCGSEVESGFLRCPTCMRKLKEPCRSCSKPLDPRWQVCPYCETEVTPVAGTPRTERARRRARRQSTREEPRVQRTADRNASDRPASDRNASDRNASDRPERTPPAARPERTPATPRPERTPPADDAMRAPARSAAERRTGSQPPPDR